MNLRVSPAPDITYIGPMTDRLKLKEKYILAKCCSPGRSDEIRGYFSFDDFIKVHRADCANLTKAESDRLVQLAWEDILDKPEAQPERDISELEEIDWRVLQLHAEVGVDYSLKVARLLHEDKQAVFDSHQKLREMGLLARVEPLIIQYRKGVVDNKWIKHRNHTYYDLTEKGRLYLQHRR